MHAAGMPSKVLDEFHKMFGEPATPDWKNLGEEVAATRTRLGLSQEQLAEALDVSATTVRLIENGRQSNYQRRTFRRLDLTLHWPPTGWLHALNGSSPYMAQNHREFWDDFYPEAPQDVKDRLRYMYGPDPDVGDEDEDETVGSVIEDTFPAAPGAHAEVEVSNREVLEAVVGLRAEFDQVRAELGEVKADVAVIKRQQSERS